MKACDYKGKMRLIRTGDKAMLKQKSDEVLKLVLLGESGMWKEKVLIWGGSGCRRQKEHSLHV